MPHNWSKLTRRRTVKDLTRLIERQDGEEWLEKYSKRNGDYGLLAPPVGSPAEHISNGSKLEVALMIGARAGASQLRGNKTAKPGSTRADKACTACPNPLLLPEDETHVMVVCSPYWVFRARMEDELERWWTPEQKEAYRAADDRTKKLLLLGLPFGPNDTDREARRARDKAVKVFLVDVDRHRIDSMGMQGLRDTYPRVQDGSMEEAREAERAAAEARRSLDASPDEDTVSLDPQAGHSSDDESAESSDSPGRTESDDEDVSDDRDQSDL